MGNERRAHRNSPRKHGRIITTGLSTRAASARKTCQLHHFLETIRDDVNKFQATCMCLGRVEF